MTGSDALAVRASKRLRNDELLVTSLGATILRKHMDDVPLWRGNHVAVKQLADDFARYLYLPRLAGPEVLLQATRTWHRLKATQWKPLSRDRSNRAWAFAEVLVKATDVFGSQQEAERWLIQPATGLERRTDDRSSLPAAPARIDQPLDVDVFGDVEGVIHPVIGQL